MPNGVEIVQIECCGQRKYETVENEAKLIPDWNEYTATATRGYSYTIRNDAGAKQRTRIPGPTLEIRNADDKSKPLEVVIYDQIGRDDWTGEGFTAADFARAIAGHDDGQRELLLRVNTRGGDVDEGITMYHRTKEWTGPSTAIVDGDASSIGSVLILGAKKVKMPRNGQILIHEAHVRLRAEVDADGMRKLSEELIGRLEAASNRIANIYAGKTGRTTEEMRGYMRKASIFNGDQAKAIGLIDEISDGHSLYNLTDAEIETFRREPKPPQPTPNPPAPAMNRQQLIDRLTKHGIKFEASASDADLLALLDTFLENAARKPATPAAPPATPPAPASPDAAAITELKNELAQVRQQRAADAKVRITAAIDELIRNDQVTGAERDKAIARAVADETYLDELRARPAVPPGPAALANDVRLTAEDPREVSKAILNLWGNKGVLDERSTRERGLLRAQIITAQWKRLEPLMNANTVSADLKRTVILQQMIRAFAIRVLPLGAFSTVFNGVRLEGTDKVAVPYFPLKTTASQDFVAATGYNTGAVDINSDAKTVTVDQRKFQYLKWTSAELSRQPYLNPMQNAMMQAEQLGLDVVAHVLARVIAATFTATAYSQAAAAFDTEDVAELKGACDLLNWPAAGRSLILNSPYDVNLLKDQKIINSLQWGDNAPIREGRIQRLIGFDYFPDGRVPDNGEGLQGFCVFKSALLVATAPVKPTAEVNQQLARYEEVIEPTIGAAFSYRLWGNPDLDETREVIECAFGDEEGEDQALKRITT